MTSYETRVISNTIGPLRLDHPPAPPRPRPIGTIRSLAFRGRWPRGTARERPLFTATLSLISVWDTPLTTYLPVLPPSRFHSTLLNTRTPGSGTPGAATLHVRVMCGHDISWSGAGRPPVGFDRARAYFNSVLHASTCLPTSTSHRLCDCALRRGRAPGHRTHGTSATCASATMGKTTTNMLACSLQYTV